MESLKSSLKELRGVLVEIQTSVGTIKAQAYASEPILNTKEKEELEKLRRLRDKTAVALSSMINKIESALKN